MLKMPTIVLGVFVAMILGEVARAGTPIEFTFTGVYTQVEAGAAHAVGEQFTSTVLFDPDALDTNPSAIIGEYPFISWTVPRSRSASSATFQGPFEGEISVGVGSENTWRVDRVVGLDTLYSVVIRYPSGTFASDALPNSLSLANSIGDEMQVTEQNLTVIGDITGIAVRQIPEPWSFSIIAFGGLLLRRRH
jgi:hypothetical protein